MPQHVLASLIILSLLVGVFWAAGVIGVTGTGCPLWHDTPIYGVALPWVGPVYFCGQGHELWVREHELCHISRMEQMGALRHMLRYFLDRAWSCQEETECGYIGDHPRCR